MKQKKYNTKHVLVRTLIHWELCKRLMFEHADKWNMHNPESGVENETHQILYEFLIQAVPPIHARKPDLMFINQEERSCFLVVFAVLVDHQVKV